MLTLIAFAMCWLGVAFGVYARGVESASNLPMPIMILPLLGSGFVPTASMPAWLQWFAEWQPFTPFTETVRSLLFGTPMGMNGWLTVGVVRRHHDRRLGVGALPLRAQVGALTARGPVSLRVPVGADFIGTDGPGSSAGSPPRSWPGSGRERRP